MSRATSGDEIGELLHEVEAERDEALAEVEAACERNRALYHQLDEARAAVARLREAEPLAGLSGERWFGRCMEARAENARLRVALERIEKAAQFALKEFPHGDAYDADCLLGVCGEVRGFAQAALSPPVEVTE